MMFAADPEANIIFGTSFNERLGEEVAITVIATGFDGRRQTERSRTAAGSTTETTGRAPRDFLQELERQRSQMSETGVPDAPAARVEDFAHGNGNGSGNGASNGARGSAEPVAVRRPAYDADDLEIPSFLRRTR